VELAAVEEAAAVVATEDVVAGHATSVVLSNN